MTQFLEIINLLSNPTAILPNSEQQKLIQEFERLKESDNGWKDCIQLITSDQNLNDQTKFFCMQVVENYLKKRYKTSESGAADQELLRSFMGFWLQSQMTRKANEKNFLTKKAAQLFALVSLIDFPARWPTFFTDLMLTSQWSVGNADFYLKVLAAIDAEIVDREIPRTVDEANLIKDYKDAMRLKCVNELVESWQLLLKEHSAKNPEITCQCLEIIGQYASWIEISLIVNERFLEFFSFALRHVDLRETACACLEEIVNKGMDIRPKLKLIDYLWENLIRANALALEQQIGLLNDEQDNCDYLLKFGKLLNTIGENLFQGWHKVQKKEPDISELIFKSIEEKLPFALRLLNHTDDDISESVFEYCMHYISMLKVTKVQTQQQQTHIQSILTIVIYKMKYDPSFNFDNEGEDEAMFLEYRKSLKQVLDSIAQLDANFVLTTVKNLVLSTASDWRAKSFIDIENSLYLLYLISEAIPSSQSNHFQQGTYKNECLCEMLQATVTSNLVENSHRIVKLQYFENLARYFKFFQIYPALLEPAIEHFIGASGLHSMDAKLRSRVSYLFSRFTKDLRTQLSQYVEKILQTIQDLLAFWNPLETPPQLLLQKHEQQQHLYDDQIFIYETVSYLVVNSSLDAKLKAQLMRNILAPIVNTFVGLVQKYAETGDEKVRLVYATSLNVAMSVATRVSKGFSNLFKVKDCECTEIFLEILRIFIQAIPVNTTHKALIHAGIRQYMHRMIIVIDNEVLEYIPVTIEQFLKVSNEPRDLNDLMPLINQVLAKYKQQVTGLMQNVLMQLTNMTLNYVNSLPAELSSDILRISPQQIQNLNVTVPILSLSSSSTTTTTSSNNNNIINFTTNNRPTTSPSNRVMNGGSTTTTTTTTTSAQDEMDDMAISPDTQYVLDIQSLYKAYFLFLSNIVNNDLMDVFLNHTSNDIYKVYCALLQGVQIGPPDISKACLQVIKKLISFFVDKPVIENFIPFTIQNLVPCCLQVLTQNIDINDAQQVLVLNELGQCLILLYNKFGDEFINYLELTYLPTLDFGAQISQGLIQIIKTNNPKAFKDLVLVSKKKLIA